MQKKIEGNKALRKNLPDGGERITRRRKQIEVLKFYHDTFINLPDFVRITGCHWFSRS